MENKFEINIESKLENVAIVRVAVAAFLNHLNITIDELSDIKTAVSEAVTNSIEHGYEKTSGSVYVECKLATLDKMSFVSITVRDYGCGIENVELATTPTYTSKPELEHAGMGFTIMETFMDDIVITSEVGKGTTIVLSKKLRTIKN